MGKTLTDLEAAECQKLVQYKVRRFFGSQLRADDYEDVCSQTMVQVLAKLSGFDASRGTLFSFMSRVATSAVHDHVRQQRTRKRRSPGALGSLNSVLRFGDGGCQQLWQTLDGQWVKRHRGARATDADDIDLSIDLEQVASHLGDDDRALLALKLAGDTVREIAAELGVCPGTVYRRLGTLKRKLKTLKSYL